VNLINWTAKAVQVTIRDSVSEKLPVFPDCTEVKALRRQKYGYRLRVGDYRVLFDFDGRVRIIAVQEVRKRDEHTC